MKSETDNQTLPLLPDEAPNISENSIVRRLNIRVLAFVTTIALLCCLNHNNIGFAANDLCEDLDLDNTGYGIGVMVLYVGLFLLQIVGNEFLKLMGGPAWFALTLFIWGVAGVGLGYIHTAAQFYGLVAVLGVAQGTTYPAVLYYLCLFYPLRMLDASYFVVVGATAFSVPVTSFVSAAIVAVANEIGWEGWRAILVVEGVMPIIFAVIVVIYLPKSPAKATFLKPEEKRWLESEMDHDTSKEAVMPFFDQVKRVMTNIQVQIAAVAMFAAFGVNTVLIFFVNLIIRTALNGPDEENKGACGTRGGNQISSIVLTAVPYICSGIACLLMGHFADRIKNRKMFAVTMQLVAGVALSLWDVANSFSFGTGFAALIVAVSLTFPPQATVLSLGAANVEPEVRATTLAYLNSSFALAGLVFPLIIGVLGDTYGYGWSVTVSGFLGVIAGIAMIFLKDPLAKKQNDDNVEVNA